MLRVPASSDVFMTPHRPPHLHLLHPALSSPVSFSFHLIKINQQLLFGTSVMESERILPNSGLLVSVSRSAGLVSMVHCSAFLLPVNALLAGMQLRLRLLKSVHAFLFSPLSPYDHEPFPQKHWQWYIFLKIEFNCSSCLVHTPWTQLQTHNPLRQWSFQQVWQVRACRVGPRGFCNTSKSDGSVTSDHLHLCIPSTWEDSLVRGGSKDPLDLLHRNTNLKICKHTLVQWLLLNTCSSCNSIWIHHLQSQHCPQFSMSTFFCY